MSGKMGLGTMAETQILKVFLNELPVGRLSLDARERCEFRLLESYKQAYPRPVLGQGFLDEPDKIHATRARVPPWFSNLLPEGPLRDLIAKRVGVSEIREFHLLAHLGEDLPGAVRLRPEEDRPLPFDAGPAVSTKDPADPGPWRFSLAGVQLKFSANQRKGGLTVPVSGLGGDWIIKLPDARFPQVPLNEWASMQWARESGIQIPEIDLVALESVSGLPEGVSAYGEQQAFAIRRFDRPTPQGKRVQMEDFAQILGLFPEQKYAKYNYETLASLLLAIAGPDAVDRFIHRLLFVIASGNGDAHHKNWTLVYPNGVNAQLSPAYDLVSTIQYLPNDQLALNLAKSKRFADVDMKGFSRMARKIGLEEDWMESRVRVHRERILDAWGQAKKRFDFAGDAVHKIEAHLREIPLFR